MTSIISDHRETEPTAQEMQAIFFGDVESTACQRFVRPGQVAPHLTPPDHCVRCGQPQRAHKSRAPGPVRERLDRLNSLAPDQIAAGLAWLSGYKPEVFDSVLDAAETWDDGGDLLPDDDLEPFCSLCNATIGIFLSYGKEWYHYRGEGTVTSKIELYKTDHSPVLAWR